MNKRLYKRKTKPIKILLLDKNDVTCVCGSFTNVELCDKLNLTHKQLIGYMDKQILFENKYILVEDE